MTNTRRKNRAGAGGRGRAGLGAALLALPLLGLAGCDLDSLLRVDDPDVVLPETIEGPLTLPAVRGHALAEFALAYVGAPIGGGNTEGQILMSGLIADEFIHTGTFDTRENLDRRIIDERNPHIGTVFHNLHRARAAAELAGDVFARHGPNTLGHAEAHNLEGMTLVMLGETYCSGVPVSTMTTAGAIEYGAPQTTVQVFQSAIQRFEAARTVASAGGLTQQQHLAQLGIARALLGLGRYQEAAAAAAGVPTGFEYVIWHSENTARQNNGVWAMNNLAGRWSVPDREGTNGLPFRSEGRIDGTVQDPRIPSTHIGLAQRTGLRPAEHYGQLKFELRSSNTVVANGIEARLIEAEAALNRGASAAYLTTLNELRAGIGLAALTDPGTADGRVDQFFQERAYWLWLTGRRLGDLRRLMWDYGRSQSEIFPIGQHHRGGTYGEHTNLPIPFDERNNPLSAGCLQRDDHGGRHG
jgi:starch-binding outer membrane protein, SusD/RagB family